MRRRTRVLVGLVGAAAGVLILAGGLVAAQEVVAQEAANTTGAADAGQASPPAAGAAAASAGGVVQAPADDVPPPEPAPPETAPSNAAAAADNTEAAEPPAPPEPLKRPRYTTAVLQALDKVTAETLRFEAKVNEPVRYKDLVITVQACETTAPDEGFSDSATHLNVQYQPDVLPGRAPRIPREVFRGWMFAQAPGLNPFQHPIYDVWVIACRTPVPAPALPPTDGGAPAAASGAPSSPVGANL